MYVDDIESREEGGTPAIIESIRAGLCFQLKQVTLHSIVIYMLAHLLGRI